MSINTIKYLVSAGVLVGLFSFSSCHSGYSLASVEGGRIEINSKLDAHPDADAVALLAPYKAKVDSIMLPVIGYSSSQMKAYRPESELSNLVADVLRFSAARYIGHPADVGVTNMGGLRSSLPQGEITFGNIYEITPFENTLCIVTMNGTMLRQLFEDIAKVHGEGLSGANIVITKEGQLLNATVGGIEIDNNRNYEVATLDYLAEGNDHMNTFGKINSTAKILPEGALLRLLFLDYVKNHTKAGQNIDSKVAGRIIIK